MGRRFSVVFCSWARRQCARRTAGFGWAGERCRRPEPSAVEEETTRELTQGVAVVKAIRCGSDCTRPLSWLGSISFGVHPHTKGTLCSAGGHRRRIPLDPRGLLAARNAVQVKAPGDLSGEWKHVSRRSAMRTGYEVAFSSPTVCRQRAHVAEGCSVLGPSPGRGMRIDRGAIRGGWGADLFRALPRLAWRPAFRAGLLAVDGKSAFAIGIFAAGPERAGLARALAGSAAAQGASRARRQLDG